MSFINTENITFFLILTAILVGTFLPMQAGMNAQLGQLLGHPFWGTLASFGSGTLGIFILLVANRIPLPSLNVVTQIPWYYWLGGLIGATFITFSIILAPRLGAATLIASTVTGQLLASIFLDHYGWLGFPEHPITPFRVAGIILLLLGVFLIQRF